MTSKNSFKKEKEALSFDNQLPYVVYCEITNMCPFKCKICAWGQGLVKRHGSMTKDIFKKVVDEISLWEPKRSLGLYSMGEPLYHPMVFDYIRYAKSKGLRVFFATNASLLDREKQIKLAESGIDELKISFEAEDPEIYEKIRVGGNYKDILHNIQSFLRLLTKRNIKISIDILVIKYDENESLDVSEKFKNLFLSLYDVNFYSYHVANMNWKNNIQASLLRNKGYSSEPMRKVCPKFNDLVVSWDGKFRHCDLDFNDEYSSCSIENMSAKDFWFNENRRKILEKMEKGDWGSIDLCKGCSAPYTLSRRRRLYESKGKKVVLDKALHSYLFVDGRIADNL